MLHFLQGDSALRQAHNTRPPVLHELLHLPPQRWPMSLLFEAVELYIASLPDCQTARLPDQDLLSVPGYSTFMAFTAATY